VRKKWERQKEGVDVGTVYFYVGNCAACNFPNFDDRGMLTRCCRFLVLLMISSKGLNKVEFNMVYPCKVYHRLQALFV
jgi:hypothetical protein